MKETGHMMDKQELRHQMKHRLAAMIQKERVAKSKLICQHLLARDEFSKSSVVMTFLSMPHEVDTTPIILHAWQQGKTVAVPKVSFEQRHMIPVEIQSLETGLVSGRSGLRNPLTGVPVPFDEIDLILIPGLAFDREGNRLGRGGSYYDRFLQSDKLKNALRWVLAYDIQILDSIPHTDHDVAVDAIVSESGIHFCNRS